MFLSVYDSRIEFRAGPSRELAARLVLAHFLAALAIGLAGLPGALLLLLFLSLLHSLRRALRPLGRAQALAWSAAGGWERIGVGNYRESMELRPSSVVTNGAMFLHWQVGRRRWRILLCEDSMHADDWRRMQVIVGLYEGRDRMAAAAADVTLAGKTTGTAPGLVEWRMDSPGFRGACPHGHKEQRPVAGRKGPAR